jgi:hypothetical protein
MDQEPKTGWRSRLEPVEAVKRYVLRWIEIRLPLAARVRILQRRRRNIERDLDRLSPISLGAEEIGRRQFMARTETRHLNDEVAVLQTRMLMTQAEHLSLPVSDLWKDWETTPVTSRNVLTVEAQHRVRAAIRQEKKDRSELLRLWLAGVGPVISTLTGLIGAAIGLIALLTK